MAGRATATAGNLPSELSSFIGRRRELQDVKAALSATRLVTLVGPGGVGKTRLALRSATDLRRGIADGVWMVELAGLRDPELVTQAVMTALGLRDELSGWPVSRLIEYVAAKQLLLVLDNCEHLLDACRRARRSAASGGALASGSSRPAGSRLAFREKPSSRSARSRCRMATRACAPTGSPGPRPSRLLVERAREAGAAFEVTPDNQAAVIELARRLDGIPLAIELAAVRLRTLGLDQLVERLNDRFQPARWWEQDRARPPPNARSHDRLEPRSPGRGRTGCPATDERLRGLLQPGSGRAGRPSRRPNATVRVWTSLTNLVDRSFVIREGTSETGTVSTPREHARIRAAAAPRGG